MLNYCPDYLFTLGKISTNSKGSSKDSLPTYNNSLPTISLECILLEIKTDQFVSLIVKDANKKQHTLLVLKYFEGVFLLLENKIKVNDKIKINYSEQELYDPLIKDFRIFKVIDSLEKM